jgi:hypothetical protein
MADKKSVAATLVVTLALEPKEGESAVNFAYRLAQAANEMADETWESLPTAAQKWVNAALEAVEKIEDTPLPEGIEIVMSPKTEATDGNGAEEPAMANKASSGSKKAAAQASAKAKTGGGKKAAVKGNGKGGTRPGPQGKFASGDKITKLVRENPYREGSKSHGVFKKYKNGMTVQSAIDAGITRAYLLWDVKKEHIAIAAAK